MSEQEQSQEPEEREETVDDLDVPEEDAENVDGGIKRGIDN